MRRIHRILAMTALVTVSGAPHPSAGGTNPQVRPIATPAKPGSRLPNLTALGGGRVLMSWMEPAGAGRLALRCASHDGTRWSVPSTIAEGDSFFANWADFPSVRSLGGGRVAAHWLWKSGTGTYAYDVRIAQSSDAGIHWQPPITPHRDATATEHGFVSLVPASQGALAVWLDGRNAANFVEGSEGPTPDMTLRSAVVSPSGELSQECEIDGRVCDCCQTAAAVTDRGMVVAYRDRSSGEIRDIGVARFEQGKWIAPRVVHPDGWHIAGCPVNGPALDAQGSRVVMVWFTAAADTPRVQCAFSEDGGATFGPAVRLDDGDPLGRVHVALLGDGSALVTWLESRGKDALIRARRVGANGRLEPSFTVVRTSAARGSGFPRLVRSGNQVYLAWTEAGPKSQVRIATLALR